MDAPRLAGVERRPDRLGSMFTAISWRYDLLNALMSLGQDGAWRRALVDSIPRGARVLDLCCGSARSSVPAFARSGRTVTGLDVSYLMLQRGRTHAQAAGAKFDPVHGDGFRLPFRDGTFDVVTAAFGLRNLVPLPEAAREIQRVLVPGGRFLALDSVAPAGGAFAPFHAFYLRYGVPLMGRLSPDPAAYRYLSESIFDFGTPAEVARRLETSGFAAPVKVIPLLLGAVAIFEARRDGTGPELNARSPLNAHSCFRRPLGRTPGVRFRRWAQCVVGACRREVGGRAIQREDCTLHGEIRSARHFVERAMSPLGPRPERPVHGGPRRDPAPGTTDRATLWVLLALHVALEITLIAAGWTLVKYLPTMALEPGQKVMFEVGLAAAFVAFGLRGLGLWRQLRRGGAATHR